MKIATQTQEILILTLILFLDGFAYGQRQVERLGRGVVAIDQGGSKVYAGWRLLGTEPNNIGFSVYRDDSRVNDQPIVQPTNLVSNNGNIRSTCTVHAVIDGAEGKPSAPTNVWGQNYLVIPLQTPEGYRPNDASVGDLDGDGVYDMFSIRRAGARIIRGLTGPIRRY